MSHLTHDQLSALLDQRLGLGERGVAERHLQECRACRDAYHDLEAQDRRLQRGLSNDPGDSYFSSFVDVVQTRIEAEGVNARRGVPGGPGNWLDRPMNLAFAGVAVAVVLGLGAALLASRHAGQSPLVNDQLQSRTRQVGNTPAATPPPPPTETTAEPAPVLGLSEEAANQAKQFRERDKQKTEGGAAATKTQSTNAYEVTRNPATGEEERVGAAHGNFAPAPTAGPASSVADAKKALVAQPLAKDASRGDEVTTRREGSAADAEARFCGNVHDANGRPLRFASITLVRRNTGIQSDDRGRFCLYTTPGSDSMIVTLLGFKPMRRLVRISADAPDLNVQLDAVPALSTSAVSLRTLPSPGAAAKSSDAASSTPAEMMDALPDSIRQVADLATRYSDVAARSRDAHQHDAAAAQWEKLLHHVQGSALEVHTRGRVAEERYRAWEAEPTDRRAQDAREALTAFLVRAPQGAERNRDALWLDEVTK